MNYLEKLKDPRWQKKRLGILERDKWMCRACCDKEKTLHVHHIFYIPGMEPWEIPDGLLITFCSDCHKPGPCEGHASCESCPDYGKGEYDCKGYSEPAKEIIDMIGDMLNQIWVNDGHFGGHTFNVCLGNAHYSLKPEYLQHLPQSRS